MKLLSVLIKEVKKLVGFFFHLRLLITDFALQLIAPKGM